MGAVEVRGRAVVDARFVVEEVPAVDVVDVAVEVVVNPVARGLERVRPDVRLEVLVVDVDAGVDDADVDVPAADLVGVPCPSGAAAERVLSRSRPGASFETW